MSSFFDRLFLWRKRIRFAQALQSVEAGQGDILEVGILAEATRWDRESRRQAEDALIRLLPRIECQDSYVERESHRRCFDRYLSPDTPDTELTLVLLNSIECIADRRVVYHFSWLQSIEPRDEIERAIKQAAKKAYPRLVVLVQQRTPSLLIPANPPLPSVDLLLHSSFPPSIPANTIRSGPEAK
jgi:hypothetical protein